MEGDGAVGSDLVFVPRVVDQGSAPAVPPINRCLEGSCGREADAAAKVGEAATKGLGSRHGRAHRSAVRRSKHVIARALWDYAEDAHVQRALSMTDEEHRKVENIGAWYDLPDYPIPIEGQRITHNHVTALAAVTLFEGSVRPLAQNRRRPEKDCPSDLKA